MSLVKIDSHVVLTKNISKIQLKPGVLQRSLVLGSRPTGCMRSSRIGACVYANFGVMLGARTLLDRIFTAMRNNGSIASIGR